jgi:hypothetical protein
MTFAVEELKLLRLKLMQIKFKNSASTSQKVMKVSIKEP